MRIMIASVAIGALVASATAQDAPPQDDVLSELDRLSRSADDPFSGVIDQEQREPVSVTLRALDKITARYTDLEIEMHQIARFGSLEIQPRFCDKRPPEEFPETTAFLEIFDTEYGARKSDLKITLSEPITEDIAVSELDVLPIKELEQPALVEETRQSDRYTAEMPAPEVLSGPHAEGLNIFRGWMFASSPALNALEHPVYDVWVISCKTRIVDN